ncbi:MAG TPA: cupin domain-containing protein [Pyrinomonadaceae bacterium]|nr:cupin domain-containing protein [Pyrinomonadaceae bacterium]
MKITSLSRKALVAIALGCVLLVSAVYAATTVILAVGTIPESELYGGPATVTVRTLTIQPGESLAWHHHPGYAFNVVKSGVLTVEEGCGGPDQTLLPGQAFEEVQGEIHRAKNLGTEPTVVYNTFIMPQGRPTTINTPNNERLCGPPTTPDACKDDGWMQFTFPQTFENQGACVKWVIQRPKTTIPIPD